MLFNELFAVVSVSHAFFCVIRRTIRVERRDEECKRYGTSCQRMCNIAPPLTISTKRR
ncbi:holin [Geobacillus sp. A8]|nr:holin [Geobacillus sp. A8]